MSKKLDPVKVKFGRTLNMFRKRTRTESGRILTQEGFSQELEFEHKIEYSHAALSNLERGKSSLSNKRRPLLLAMIKVLIKFDGIQSIQEANTLLKAGEYRQLDIEEINILGIKEIDRPKPLSPYFAKPQIFVNREVPLQSLEAALVKKRKVVFIVGRGGLGKSTLIRQFLWHQQENRQLENAFVVDVEAFATFERINFFHATMAQIGQLFTTIHAADQPNSSISAKVRNILRSQKCLIVLDGVENEKHSAILAKELLQTSDYAQFIITTRVAPEKPFDSQIISLDDLDSPHARLCMQEQANLTPGVSAEYITSEVGNIIYKNLGGHPHILRIITSLLAQRSFQRLLKSIEQGKVKDINDIYDVLWDQLSNSAQTILKILCFTAADGIDVDYLIDVSGFDEETVFDAIDELTRYTLITTKRLGLEVRQYRIHNLTKLYISVNQVEGLDDIAKSSLSYWQTSFMKLAESQWHHLVPNQIHILATFEFSFRFKASPQLNRSRRLFLVDFHEFVKIFGYSYVWDSTYEKVVNGGNKDLTQCQLLQRIGTLKRSRQELNKADDYFREAFKLASNLNNLSEQAYAAYNLGLNYFKQGFPDQALDYCVEAGKLFNQIEENSIGFIATLNLFGRIYEWKGDFPEALKHDRRAFSLCDKKTPKNILVDVIRDLTTLLVEDKQMESAREVFKAGVELVGSKENYFLAAKLLTAQSYLEIMEGNFDAAKQLIEQINFDFLSRERLWSYSAPAIGNLAYIALMEQNYNEGLKLIEKSIEQSQLAFDDYQIANAMDTLGDIHFELSNLTTAKSVYQDALHILDRHPDEARVLTLINTLRRKVKKCD